MDRSKVESLIAFHRDRLRDFLGLTDWTMRYNVIHLGGSMMECDLNLYEYKIAKINVDADEIADEMDLIEGIYHEYCHIYHADFSVYRHAFRDLTRTSEAMKTVEKELWDLGSERLVHMMEWLWRTHLRDLYLDQVTRPEVAR